MKPTKTVCKSILLTGLAVAALTWQASPALAGKMNDPKPLVRIQTVEDVQQIEAGDTIVMTCPKCKDTYTQVVKTSMRGTTEETLRTGTHLCSACDSHMVTQGQGKQAKNVMVHTCKACGSEDVSCCLMKKGSGPTPGMEEEKK